MSRKKWYVTTDSGPWEMANILGPFPLKRVAEVAGQAMGIPPHDLLVFHPDSGGSVFKEEFQRLHMRAELKRRGIIKCKTKRASGSAI